MPRQPLLAGDLVVYRAPTQVWSGVDGEVGGRAIHGVYHADVRFFSGLELRVGGAVPEPVTSYREGASTATFVSLLRDLDTDPGADPRVRLDRTRTVSDGCVTETLTVTSRIATPIDTTLALTLRPDFSPMHAVKAGEARDGTAPAPADSGATATAPASADSGATAPATASADSGATAAAPATPGVATFAAGTARAVLTAPGAALTTPATAPPASTASTAGAATATAAAAEATTGARGADGAGAATTATWRLRVEPHGSASVMFTLDLSDAASVVSGAADTTRTGRPSIRSGDTRLARWLDTALDDLDALRLVTREHPDEPFLAAGAPWFFTLFGRDSLWAARFLLPFGTELAASTLRLLARLQGTREVAETAEQPGKILHELRASELLIPGEGVTLPPLYYGTVDATALWIILLHDAWKWGLDDASVRALLPNLRRALAWMRDYGDSDGDGFLEYIDSTGHGLANQGWKDSGDSIQWRDGRLAEGPIALCEVQGYAYEAAIGGAELLAHFAAQDAAGPAAHPATPHTAAPHAAAPHAAASQTAAPQTAASQTAAPNAAAPHVAAAPTAAAASGAADEAGEWRSWAAALKQRFADRFWIDSPDGAYPAVALDAAKRRVDTVTSNIGHLLGTGIVTPDQARLIARRLVSPELSSGYGLRTMSTDSAGYWPLSYHGGSVWAHDTAIAIAGLGREGLTAEASVLIEGLLAAAEGFDFRMPELHSGDPAAAASRPVPYPAACRPQAWSAAAAVSVLSTALGLAPGGAGERAGGRG